MPEPVLNLEVLTAGMGPGGSPAQGHVKVETQLNGSFVYLDTDFFFWLWWVFVAVLWLPQLQRAGFAASWQMGSWFPSWEHAPPTLEGRFLATGQLDKPLDFLFHIHNGT